jgi:hypothetical protein
MAIELQVSDEDSEIAYCDLFVNNQLVRRDTAQPFLYGQGSGSSDAALSNLSTGSYALTATCADTSNLSTTTTANVTVASANAETTLRDVDLVWKTPTARTDGTSLAVDEIASYEIYYFIASDPTSGETITVPAVDGDGNIVNGHQIKALLAGEYYFSIASVDVNNNVSEFVNPVALLIE